MRERRTDGRRVTRRAGLLGRLAGDRTPPSDSERIAAAAAAAEMPVEDVLREVADFRLALETDLIIAAAAVDADSVDVLSDVLDDERTELATFHDRLLSRLADAAVADEMSVQRRRHAGAMRTSRLIAVAAAVVTLLGVGQSVVRTHHVQNAAALKTADRQYRNFSSAITSQSPGAVATTAQQLHQTLQELISEHAGDPEVAARTAQMLQAEIALLRINNPAGATQVIAQAQSLVTLLKAKAPPKVRASVAPVLNAASSPSPSKKASPSP